MRAFALLLLSFCIAGCQTVSTADLAGEFAAHGMHVSQGDPPEGSRPLKAVAYYRNGFYIAGLIPVVGVALDDAVDEVTAQARSVNADGISNLSYEFIPASFFRFVVFPIPDWSATLRVSGMAYQLTGPAPWK